MLEFAEYYKNISKPLAAGQRWSNTLARINKLEIKTCVPLLMDIFKANAEGFISPEELCDAFRVIENYIIRREICDLPTNALNKVFVQLGAEVEKDIEDKGMSYYDALRQEIMKKTGKSRFPNAQEFEDKFKTYDLYNTKSSIKKYILERLENYENPELVAVEELIDNGTLTIEHIMPQTLTDEWKNMLGEKWELIHTKYKDTIGNLTLTAYNSDYSNSPFKVKKTMPEKGFQFDVTLSVVFEIPETHRHYDDSEEKTIWLMVRCSGGIVSLAVPTPDHFYPLLYALEASDKDRQFSVYNKYGEFYFFVHNIISLGIIKFCSIKNIIF